MSMSFRTHCTLSAAALGLACSCAHAQSWTLALSWKDGACASDNSNLKCVAKTDAPTQNNTADAPINLRALTLRTARTDCDATALPADALSADTGRYVAAIDKDSYAISWRRYGSCSGYTPAGYFAELAAMANAVNRTNLGQYMNQHAGKRVPLDELKDAQLHDFFFGADKAVQFYCAPDGRLAEVHYTLRDWSDLFVYRDKGSMLMPASGGNCGDEVVL